MLTTLDFTIFVLFCAVVVGVSMFKGRRETGGEEEYFLAGHGLPWWLIGISLIAANISSEQFVGMNGGAAGSYGSGGGQLRLAGDDGTGGRGHVHPAAHPPLGRVHDARVPRISLLARGAEPDVLLHGRHLLARHDSRRAVHRADWRSTPSST